MTGPTIQEDMVSILMRWRTYAIAYSADIEKMYRQIRVVNNHTDYQRILWRCSPLEPVKDYCLSTVTFGTTSAPFLAIQTLQQLAHDEKDNYPEASNITLKDVYVDNVLSGADSVQQAMKAQTQLIAMMKSGGLPLRKWSSNSQELLLNVPEQDRELSPSLTINFDDSVKTLGLHWYPASDTFSYNLSLIDDKREITKRTVLSEVAKLFDPLGWLAPVIITGKVFIQTLWLQKIDWDERLNLELTRRWLEFRGNLQSVENISIPRWLGTFKYLQQQHQIHAFCDASNKAYAAVAYLRITEEGGHHSVRLIAAKTKVAPVRTVSLPRLELCGAVLLTRLVSMIINVLQIDNIKVYAWCDSTITLAWIKGPPYQWKTFVSNRVSEIHENLKYATWSHLPSADNPADCASRGLSPKALQSHSIWFSGPEWLSRSKEYWPQQKYHQTKLEKRNTITLQTSVTQCELLEKFSSLCKLVRVTAYLLRFFNAMRKKSPKSTWLSAQEHKNALTTLIKISQSNEFGSEIRELTTKTALPKNSRLLSLHPYLDGEGILRVGGRLEHSDLNYQTKHPIILSEKSRLTKLIIQDIHYKSLHGGTQVMLALLRKRYWILNARNSVKSCIHRCVTCFRHKATAGEQLMGSLPKPRVTQSRPFCHTGIDYCGPFNIKISKGRGTRSYKGYVAIFVCLATKAIHLETVSDLTTNAFLAAFRRFVARRGMCSDVYSDNGTNFIGARTVLHKEFEQAITNNTPEIAKILAKDMIEWHFIPPASPHYGGLWEAGVKSTKHHLRRVIAESKLTFEEFTTVLTQVEATLNSRPICPMTSDINDLNFLTPGHFLIQDELRLPPETINLDLKLHTLDRWKALQHMCHSFWRRWSNDYLTRMQQRPKWAIQRRNFTIGDMVLIKDEKLPPAKWLLGRIVEVHPGQDKLTRAVTVRTKDSLWKRPITKICLLPMNTPYDTL